MRLTFSLGFPLDASSFFCSFLALAIFNLLAFMMSYLDLISSKKRKREERVFRFKIFGENGYPVEFDGSFQQNIKKLLELGHFERNGCSRMPSWSFKLEVIRQPSFHILLFVFEEPIEASPEHHCKHCQYVGEVLIP